jgi:hypothetical protein
MNADEYNTSGVNAREDTATAIAQVLDNTDREDYDTTVEAVIEVTELAFNLACQDLDVTANMAQQAVSTFALRNTVPWTGGQLHDMAREFQARGWTVYPPDEARQGWLSRLLRGRRHV